MKNYIKYGIIVLIGIVILIGAMHAPNRQDLFSIIMNIFTKIVAVITILGGLGGLLIWSINRKQLQVSYKEIKSREQAKHNIPAKTLAKTLLTALSVIAVIALFSFINSTPINWMRMSISVLCYSLIYYLIQYFYLKHKHHEN